MSLTNKRVVFTAQSSPEKASVNVETINPYTPPALQDGELLVEVKACAFNPTDFKHQLAKWGHEGCVCGSDLAGVVMDSKSQDFVSGDCVSVFVHGGYAHNADGGAFQNYVVVPAVTALKYPVLTPLVIDSDTGAEVSKDKEVTVPGTSTIDSFEAASSLTLGITTVGMSFQYNLQLQNAVRGSWILIWGGATATGYLAIQVAKHVYGMKVITTAREKHHEKLTAAGADVCIDYTQDEPSPVDAIVEHTGGEVHYALDTISVPETYKSCYAALGKGESRLDNLLFLDANTLGGEDALDPAKDVVFGKTLAYMCQGVEQNLNGMILPYNEELMQCHAEFWKIINKAILEGKIETLPLTILPNGFESVQDGLDRLAEGKNSFEKLIIRVNE
jgi:NADPH:quinone reductase-like Zn-dependent oxidoreductase